jgi:vanillin dehydrogenase
MATVEIAQEQQLLIGGSWVAAQGGGTYENANPYTGETATITAAAGREDARAAVDAAAAAFKEWGRSAPAMRRKILLKAADLMEERAPEIAPIVTEETGGTFGWGMFNCSLAAAMLREAGAQATGSWARSSPRTCRASWPWAYARPPAWSWRSPRGTRR